ncbi:MAG: replicative DNA helicase [Vicinamibacteria bacterium]|nr:replicative DNA helicase [Vicinamibacteria bacterium]
MSTTAFSNASAPSGAAGERSLPHNADAERTVLGAILVDNQAFNSAAEILTRDDFYRDAHRRIFEAMATLAEKSEPIDLVTLKNELTRTQSLDAAGGVAYLAGLVEGVPRLENVLPWSRIIREASVLRNLIHASARIAQEATDAQESADSILDRAEQAIFAIAERKIRAGLVPVKDFIKTTFESIEKLSQSKDAITGVPTGFVDLDRMTSGFQKGDLIILAARPAMGKTSFALNIARTAAQATAEPVAIFSLEMSKEQLVKRLIFAEARIESGLVTRGQLRDSDWGKLTTAWAELHKLPLFIDDASFLTPLELRAKCRRLKSEHGLGLIVVDYLQLMGSGGRVENRQQEISSISRSLKGLAKELEVPVLALSQLSRAPEARTDRRPQLSDLRESGAIEQDADVVMFIYRDSVYKPTEENRGSAELIIAKQRNGPTDTVNLVFLREFTRFENRAPEDYSSGFGGGDSGY